MRGHFQKFMKKWFDSFDFNKCRIKWKDIITVSYFEIFFWKSAKCLNFSQKKHVFFLSKKLRKIYVSSSTRVWFQQMRAEMKKYHFTFLFWEKKSSFNYFKLSLTTVCFLLKKYEQSFFLQTKPFDSNK